jgi:hypothetical protein
VGASGLITSVGPWEAGGGGRGGGEGAAGEQECEACAAWRWRLTGGRVASPAPRVLFFISESLFPSHVGFRHIVGDKMSIQDPQGSLWRRLL